MADPDKLYQQALNLIQGVKTPETEQMKITLQKLVQQGTITPQQFQAALINKNAFNSIVQSPQFAQAQQQALTQLQQIGEEGGLTATDKARIQDIQDELNLTERGRQEAIMQNARERGVGGSPLEMSQRLISEQGAANRAARQGTDVAALAEQRALEAIQGAGVLGGQMRGQEFGEQATKAEAQNAIDAANAAILNQANQYNTAAANAAQAQNLAEKQRISEGNVGLTNVQEQYNKELAQRKFENELAKASAGSGILQNWGQSAAAKRSQKTAYQNARDAAALQAGANLLSRGMTSFGGGSSMGSPSGYSPNVAPNQYARLGYAEGGMVEESDYKKGGIVPGKAKMEGDSIKNDIVPAMLSPGELVVPRSKTPSVISTLAKDLKKKPKESKMPSHEDIAMVLKALAHMKGDK